MKRNFILLFLIFVACTSKNSRIPSDFDPNLSPEISLIRMEKKLFEVDTQQIERSLIKMMEEYPNISRIYFEQILGWAENLDSLDTQFFSRAMEFYRDSSSYNLLNLTNDRYMELGWLEKMFGQSCGLARYYFPDFRTPRFYTLISGFNVGNFIFEDTDSLDGLGIGLDFFLGPDFDYKLIDPANPSFSNYLARTFNKDHLIKKTWEIWVDDRLGPEPGSRLLDFIIHRGKRLYILSRLIPSVHDTVLFEYSSEELEWCSKNRRAIWAFFTGENLLFENNFMKIQKYIHPSPDSPGMPQQAPGQTGSYIGYYIIEAYMKRKPRTSMSDLIKASDGQKILEESRFKPVDE
ncbi:MAG: hypothetical protein IPM48_00840 [Saprospiraceae bacterium]|nr:hypothetical protein [Saprospiraceae bacterium]